MPDDSIPIFDDPGGGSGGEGGKGGATAETLSPGLSPDQLPDGSAADALRFMHEQWRLERERAEIAERQAVELRARISELEGALKEANDSLAAVERRHRIDLLLMQHEALDLEAARILTEAAVAAMDEPDVAVAVADLRRRTPSLFRRRAGPAGAALRPAAAERDSLADLAAEAAQAGDRASVLRYLRARRAG